MMISLSAALMLAAIASLGGLQIYNLRQLNSLRAALDASAARQEALLQATGGALLKMNQTVQTLEKRVTLTSRRQQELENKDAGSLTYEQASKLIQMGAAPEDLVKTCGLSQAEAKLVSLMVARGVSAPV